MKSYNSKVNILLQKSSSWWNIYNVPEDVPQKPVFDNFEQLEKTCLSIKNSSSEKNVIIQETSWFLLIELGKMSIDMKKITTSAMNNDALKML